MLLFFSPGDDDPSWLIVVSDASKLASSTSIFFKTSPSPWHQSQSSDDFDQVCKVTGNVILKLAAHNEQAFFEALEYACEALKPFVCLGRISMRLEGLGTR